MKKSVFSSSTTCCPNAACSRALLRQFSGRAGDVRCSSGLSGHRQDHLSPTRNGRSSGRRARLVRPGDFSTSRAAAREGHPMSRERARDFATTACSGGARKTWWWTPRPAPSTPTRPDHREHRAASYPIHYIPKPSPGRAAATRRTFCFSRCDAYGVNASHRPPLAAQAITIPCPGTREVAGTSGGVTTPRPRSRLASAHLSCRLTAHLTRRLLGAKMPPMACSAAREHGLDGRPYGRGPADPLSQTRAMVRAASPESSTASQPPPDPCWMEVPLQVPGVPDELLLPRGTWSDPAAYDAQAARLRADVPDNFSQFQDSGARRVGDAGRGDRIVDRPKSRE